MPDYDNTNRFVLFVNENKNRDDEDDKSPDRTGTLNVDGVEYFMDGWLQTSKNGTPFLSGKIKPKQQRATQPKPAQKKREPDDIPF